MQYLLYLTVLVNMSKEILSKPTSLITAPSLNEIPSEYNFEFVTRQEWGARPPKQRTNLTIPVPYVVVHHSYIPPACYTKKDCEQAMRSMQNFHMDDREWWDIGYNFAVGSDGAVYEGRGWKTVGAQSLHFNTVSIGICLIGDWREQVPPRIQLETAKALIKEGDKLGYLRPDYKLVGHRQVRATECPGNALFNEIKTWPHFSEHPISVDELIQVVELPQHIKDMLARAKAKV